MENLHSIKNKYLNSEPPSDCLYDMKSLEHWESTTSTLIRRANNRTKSCCSLLLPVTFKPSTALSFLLFQDNGTSTGEFSYSLLLAHIRIPFSGCNSLVSWKGFFTFLSCLSVLLFSLHLACLLVLFLQSGYPTSWPKSNEKQKKKGKKNKKLKRQTWFTPGIAE